MTEPNYGYRCQGCGRTVVLYVRPVRLRSSPLRFCGSSCSLRMVKRPPRPTAPRVLVERPYVHWLRLAIEQRDRFWSKVDKTGPCWLWMTAVDKDGYGRFAITAPIGELPKQKHVRAHRLAWEMANGREIPAELVTRHSCHNTLCVNPAHVKPGTQAENIGDQLARGTHVSQRAAS